MSALGALLTALPRLTLVVGKGGVGKTTCSAGIALELARRGDRTLLVSTDPAGTLGAALQLPIGDASVSVPDTPLLDIRQLSAAAARTRFLERWRDRIVEIMDRGTYLDRSDIDGLVEAVLPGADEVFALLTLADLVADPRYDRIVADTAPTGHTLRLLALPRTFAALVELLDAMQEKHRFLVRTLTRRYRRDAADEFLEEMRRTIQTFSSVLGDRSVCGALLVARAEPLVASETMRFAAALRDARIEIAAFVVNAVPPRLDDSARDALARIREGLRDRPGYHIPRSAPPLGLSRIRAVMGQVTAFDDPGPAAGETSRRERGKVRVRKPASARAGEAPGSSDSQGQAFEAVSLVRDLTIVGGKGGVGKTTVSCALAIAACDSGAVTLLVSTDPAPSIADALAQPIDDMERRVAGANRLTARQMDASAAFVRFRDQYRERIDGVFEGLVAHGVDVSHDRAILRELLALAPPGVDELYALASLGETLAERRFERVVVDPAPTGHLLRLLEMPAVALDWSHRLMRMMLKYREITGLGDAAAELLAFVKRTRAVADLLRDSSRAGVVIVSLDEPLVRAETRRLAGAVRALGIDVIAVLWNRVVEERGPLPADVAGRQLLAYGTTLPLVGVDALRAWYLGWLPSLPASHHD